MKVRSTVDDDILLTINNVEFDSKGISTIYLKGLVTGTKATVLSSATM